MAVLLLNPYRGLTQNFFWKIMREDKVIVQ
jgi:hypothetical protein